jgi:phosphopentomutase
LDGVGAGELPDAAAYGDVGSNTLSHLAEQVRLDLPTLRMLGLERVVALGPSVTMPPTAAVGKMAEASAGKDSVTGHWEMMGVIMPRPFPVFPHGFPSASLETFMRLTGRGVLGNKVGSGTAILEELGPEHLRTGAFIVYTSADSVFQVAAHEALVPVAELYHACEIAYELFARGHGVGRVIARPFVGSPGRFTRTARRRDFAVPPAGETLLDCLSAAGLSVVGIGKISDLFAGRGISRSIHTASDEEGMNEVDRQVAEGGAELVFANLVDFDSRFGHRNDAAGYARNLERFDARLGVLLPRLRSDDLLLVTADHGNDPTTPGTDHSREYVPLLVMGPRIRPGVWLGIRKTFADLGQTLAEVFDVGPLAHGTSFLSEVTA